MDITQVTSIAKKMVLEWGMSEKLGFIRYEGRDTREAFIADKDYSDQTARLIDEEIRRLADEAYAEAQRILDQNWEKVVAVAEALLKHETLSYEDVDKLMKGQTLSKPSVSEMLAAEEARKARPLKRRSGRRRSRKCPRALCPALRESGTARGSENSAIRGEYGRSNAGRGAAAAFACLQCYSSGLMKSPVASLG